MRRHFEQWKSFQSLQRRQKTPAEMAMEKKERDAVKVAKYLRAGKVTMTQSKQAR